MKVKVISLLFIGVIICIGICIYSYITINSSKERIYEKVEKRLFSIEYPIIDRPGSLTNITYDEIKKKMNFKTDFLLYIGRTDCPDCQEFQPILEEEIKKDDKNGVYYFDIKEIRDKSKVDNALQEDIDFFENIKDEFDLQWVPCIYHIVNGEIIDKYEYLSIDYYFLEDEERKANLKNDYIEYLHIWIDKCNNK